MELSNRDSPATDEKIQSPKSQLDKIDGQFKSPSSNPPSSPARQFLLSEISILSVMRSSREKEDLDGKIGPLMILEQCLSNNMTTFVNIIEEGDLLRIGSSETTESPTKVRHRADDSTLLDSFTMKTGSVWQLASMLISGTERLHRTIFLFFIYKMLYSEDDLITVKES
jgi:hypothetical protein